MGLLDLLLGGSKQQTEKFAHSLSPSPPSSPSTTDLGDEGGEGDNVRTKASAIVLAPPATDPRSSKNRDDRWLHELSLDYERRFGAPYARLFAFVGRKVRTPEGPGVLHQVFRDRCAVALDAEAQKYLHFFPPETIEPVSWVVGDEDLSPKPAGRVLEGRGARNWRVME